LRVRIYKFNTAPPIPLRNARWSSRFSVSGTI
jgi:hypothetical protein